jgi:CubicO group peptidase (beta-lactamase class C family)
VDETALQAFLSESIEKHGVPGASIGLLHEGAITVAAAGVLNLETGVPVTRDSMFQIGSITKVFTATLVMKLVDDGKLELDRPIVCYLPEFALASVADGQSITARQLLTHTSGIPGDFFEDTGRGEQALAEYVRRCRSLHTNHPAGRAFSYCNAGYSVAGRLIEVLTGQSWDRVLRDWLFAPLGMSHAASLPEDLVGKLAAIGHARDGDGRLRPLPSAYAIPFSLAPAGATPTMSASDLLLFTQMHMLAGVSQDGARLLSAQSVDAMQAPLAAVPDGARSYFDHWGLGWSLRHWDGHALIGHDGNTDGQRAFLRVSPEQGIALAVLTNGGAGIDLAREAIDAVLAKVARLPPMHELAKATQRAHDLGRFVGNYRFAAGRFTISEQDDALVMRRYDRPDAEPQVTELACAADGLFSCRLPPDTTRCYVKFLDPDDNGRAGCMFHLYRRCPREDIAHA